jgi:hypothetical protein
MEDTLLIRHVCRPDIGCDLNRSTPLGNAQAQNMNFIHVVQAVGNRMSRNARSSQPVHDHNDVAEARMQSSVLVWAFG